MTEFVTNNLTVNWAEHEGYEICKLRNLWIKNSTKNQINRETKVRETAKTLAEELTNTLEKDIESREAKKMQKVACRICQKEFATLKALKIHSIELHKVKTVVYRRYHVMNYT